MSSKDQDAHLTAGVAGLTFCHEEQEDLLWVEMIVLVASIHPDIAIGLRGQLHKAKLVRYPTHLDLCEQREVIALLIGPVVNPNILCLQVPSMGLLLLRQEEYRDIDNPKGAADQ
jgi:hypothetical protein